jgi:ketosteroid isomerase-like protein
MSRENVEVVRQVYDAASRRDSAAILGLYDSNVQIDVSRTHGAVMEPVYEGPEHEGLRAWSREWHEAWEGVEYEVHELIDAGDDVVSVVTVRGRGRASGAGAQFERHAGLWTVQDGKVARVVWFPGRDEALEAAGLRERR